MALVQADDPELRLKPVGARPVLLNGDERGREMRARLEAARGRRNRGRNEADGP